MPREKLCFKPGGNYTYAHLSKEGRMDVEDSASMIVTSLRLNDLMYGLTLNFKEHRLFFISSQHRKEFIVKWQ